MLEPMIEELIEKRDEYRYKVGNIVDDDVPVSETEDDNLIISEEGDIPSFEFEPSNHVDLIEGVDGAEFQTCFRNFRFPFLLFKGRYGVP